MVDACGIFLKKQWFITSKSTKIENNYTFDPKKVFFIDFFFSNIQRFWAQVRMEM